MHASLPAPLRLAAGVALAAALVLPALGSAAAPRIALVRAGGEPLPADVDRALAAALAEIAAPLAVEDRCGGGDGPCLAALAAATGADTVLHASLRPVGGTPSLCLLRVGPGGSARAIEPLRPGLPVEPAVREAVFRLLAPARVAGSLEVQANDGSELWLDGEKRGLAPLPAIEGLAPGQHLLRVVRPGGGEARGTVEIRFEARTVVKIEPRSDALVLLAHEEAEGAIPARATSVPPGAAAGGAVATGAAAASGPTPSPAGEGGSSPSLRAPPGSPGAVPAPAPAVAAPAERFPAWTYAGWSAIGAGGALAAGALIPALAAAGARADARDLRDSAGRLPPSRLDDDRRLAERAADHDRTATALLAVGASLVAGGASVLLLELDGEAP